MCLFITSCKLTEENNIQFFLIIQAFQSKHLRLLQLVVSFRENDQQFSRSSGLLEKNHMQ